MEKADLALSATGLTKMYGSAKALDDIDLAVAVGSVHALVGPNGAGKTTLMRLVFGLAAADSGTLEVCAEVAGFVERPAGYPYLTGRQNLELLSRLDDVRLVSVAEVIDTVGLHGHEDQKLAGYSLGLRQRFGLAAALLRAPRLLVLDEPSNGLDPRGILEIHALIRRLADEGTTVLISSHSMGEVATLCDAATILDRGRVVADASIDELRDRAPQPSYSLHTSDNAKASTLLRRRAGIAVDDAHGLLVTADRARLDAAVIALGKAGIAIRELTLQQDPLTSLYLELTTGDPR